MSRRPNPARPALWRARVHRQLLGGLSIAQSSFWSIRWRRKSHRGSFANTRRSIRAWPKKVCSDTLRSPLRRQFFRVYLESQEHRDDDSSQSEVRSKSPSSKIGCDRFEAVCTAR
jgi:hypothetical protein